MPAAYSADIRGRVIASVGDVAPRREAAEEFDCRVQLRDQMAATYRATGSWRASRGREHLSTGKASRNFFANAD